MIKAGIIGVSGYGGGELLRILARHPQVHLSYVTSETHRGKNIAVPWPNMRRIVDMQCERYHPETAAERCDLVFLARENGWAMRETFPLILSSLKVVDLSADFRLKDPAQYEEWYRFVHSSPELIKRAVFGLPELHRDEIKGAQLVANPGCYVTGAVLALAPLLKHKVIKPNSIIIDSKSGVSGAGRSSFKLDYHFPELNESMKAYSIGVHRHTPEIEQELSALAGSPVKTTFTPHLMPVTRGILTTTYSDIGADGVTVESLTERYRQFYQLSPFVVILDPGEIPSTKHVSGSNYCHIGLSVDRRTNRVIAISAIDNLQKGMAGQAVENMNLMCGLDEATALIVPGVCP